MIATRLSILGLLVATATAQGNVAPNRFIPQDAQLVMRIASPAKWASQFANTKIAQVLAGESLAPLFQQLRKGIDEGMNEAKDAGVDPDLLDGLMTKYSGDMIIAVRMDLEDLSAAMNEDRPPAMAMTFALCPDDSFDLAGFAESLSKVTEEKNGDNLRDMVAGDYDLRVNTRSDAQFAIPKMIDGHLVTMFATNMERDGAHMLSTEGRREVAGVGKPFYLHVEAEQALKILFDFIAEKMDSDPNAPPIDLSQVLTDVGVGCLKSLDISLAADGSQAVLETNLATNPENRGLFASFLFDSGTPKTLRYVPASAMSFSSGGFDIGAIYKTISKVWGSFDQIAPMAFTDIEAMFEDATKVRLREDLIDHLGTEFLQVNDFSNREDIDPDDMTAMFAGTCYGVSLRNGKAFGESLEKALRSRGLHAARKSDEYQGVTVYRLRLGGVVEIEYAVTDDLLLLAIGSDDASRAQLRSILDARANPTAGLPDRIAKQAVKVPGGWNGVAGTQIGTVMENIGTMMEQIPGEMPPEAAMVLRVMGAVGKEMKQVGLDEAVQFTWASANGMRMVTRL